MPTPPRPRLAGARYVAAALAALAALGLGGCDDAGDLDRLTCPDDPGPFTLESSRVTGTLALEPPTEPLGRGDVLVLRGTANHLDDLAIREVLAGGVSAQRDAFNFKQWSAVLAYDQLATASTPDAEGAVTVTVRAIDACGREYPFAALAVPIDQTPNVAFETLSIDVRYPEARGHLPADGSTAATLTVTGTGAVAGASVELATSTGELLDLPAGGRVTLSPSPDAPDTASAVARFATSSPGATLITAAADGRVASATVIAARAPELLPASATLVPGAILTVIVESPGELATCRAAGAGGFEVHHQGAALGPAPAPVDPDPDGRTRLDVTARADAEDDGELTIVCEDVYRQVGAATFTLDASGVPPAQALDGLEFTVEHPRDAGYVPADGSAAALITVTGFGDAASAEVAVGTSGGTLAGAPDGVVILAGAPGGDSARATLLFSADGAGTILLHATAGGVATHTTIAAIGAPRLAPAGATLGAGQSLGVAVLGQGAPLSCSAVPHPDVAVTSAGQPLGLQASPLPDDAPTLTVAADPDADDGASVTVTCADLFGQASSASFTVSAP